MKDYNAIAPLLGTVTTLDAAARLGVDIGYSQGYTDGLAPAAAAAKCWRRVAAVAGLAFVLGLAAGVLV